MNIGIVTVLYKSQTVIKDFVRCLNDQTYKNFHVIFIDNDTEDRLCEEYINSNSRFSYTYVRNQKNEGVAKGNNQGINFFIEKAKCSFIHFLNNDVEFDHEFLEMNIKLMENYQLDALAPKIYYYTPREKIWYAGGCLSYWKSGPRHFGHNKKDILLGKDLFRVTYAPTCSLLVRKKIIEKTGIRMWEQLFVYYDDYIFCYELVKNGAAIFYTPTVKLYHKISTSTGGNKSAFSRYYLSRNHSYVTRKLLNINFLLTPVVLLINLLIGKRIENRGILDSLKMK